MSRQEIISVICMSIFAVLTGISFIKNLQESRSVPAALSGIMMLLDFAAVLFITTGGVR